MRFAALTQHIKVRYCMGEKLDLYFGLKMVVRRTYVKYKKCVDDKQKHLSQRYMDEAIQVICYFIMFSFFWCSDGRISHQL